MAHLDLSESNSSRTTVSTVETYVQRSHTMLLAAGIASFTIVAVAAVMMAFLF